MTNVKPHRIPRLKSPIILCFEQKNGRGVWGEARHERRVGKQFWQRISERGKRRDSMGTDQYGGYLPDQLWSLPHDTGRSTTITVRAFSFLTTVYHIDWACSSAICQHSHFATTIALRKLVARTSQSVCDQAILENAEELWFDSKQGQGILPFPTDQTVSGANPTTYSIGTRSPFFDSKAHRTWNLSLAFI